MILTIPSSSSQQQQQQEEQLALLKCKLSSERTLHGLGFDSSSSSAYLDAHLSVDQFLLQIFSHQQLDTFKGAAIAGFTKLLNTWSSNTTNTNTNNNSSSNEKNEKIAYTPPQQDTVSVVLIDVDHWNEFPSLQNSTNINNNNQTKYGIHIPYHGMLALGVKFGNFIFRWTEYGLVDIINLQNQNLSPLQLQQSLVFKTVSNSLLKYNSSTLKRIANLIIQYNTCYQYSLYDKSPIQFIRDFMECVGVSFKLGNTSLLLKVIENQWKKHFGYEKCGGLVLNPYVEAGSRSNGGVSSSGGNLYNCSSYAHFIESIRILLQYNISYSVEYQFEWALMKSMERTLRLLSMSCTFEPTLRFDYNSSSNSDSSSNNELFNPVTINTNNLKYIPSSFNMEEEFIKSDLVSNSVSNSVSGSTGGSNSDETIFVLCMDGGGTRGLILSLLLRELEKRSNRKLSDLFHLVCGTSTGGLCARCVQSGLSGEEITTLYTQLATDIFSSKVILNQAVTKLYKTVSSGNWYEGAKLESLALNKISRSAVGNDILYLNDLHAVKPKAFFVSTLVPSTAAMDDGNGNGSGGNGGEEKEQQHERVRSDEPISYIFRTYPCPFNRENQPTRYKGTWNGQNVPLSSCLRASTAAPVYFEKKRIGNSHFIDGGICNNNPTEIAITEMKKLFPNHKNFCVISLGTGKYVKPSPSQSSQQQQQQQTNEKKSWFSFGSSPSSIPSSSSSGGGGNTDRITANLTTLLDIFELSMSSEAISRRVQDLVNEQTDKNITYFRLNPTLPTDIPLDSTLPEAFELMQLQTREFIRNEEAFDKIAKLLSK